MIRLIHMDHMFDSIGDIIDDNIYDSIDVCFWYWFGGVAVCTPI